MIEGLLKVCFSPQWAQALRAVIAHQAGVAHRALRGSPLFRIPRAASHGKIRTGTSLDTSLQSRTNFEREVCLCGSAGWLTQNMSRIKGRHDTLDLIEISVSMQPSNKDVVALGGQQARGLRNSNLIRVVRVVVAQIEIRAVLVTHRHKLF